MSTPAPPRKETPRVWLARLPFRLIVGLRTGVVVGAAVGAGSTLAALLAHDYLLRGYWTTAGLVTAHEMFLGLVLTVLLGLAAALLLTFYDSITRSPDRSAVLLLVVGALATLFVVFTRARSAAGGAAVWDPLSILRSALESGTASAVARFFVVGLAVLFLVGQVIHILWRQARRQMPVTKYPPFFVTLRAARLVAWLAGPKPLTVAAIVVVVAGALGMIAQRKGTGGPHVVVVTVSGLSADHVGAYGYSRNTTPAIDALAEEAIVFENAYASAPWTVPAAATLLTSLNPSAHRADIPAARLAPRLLTLPEILKEKGYATLAFTSHPLLSAATGFDQGFSRFEQVMRGAEEAAPKTVAGWVRNRRRDRPFFLWIELPNPLTAPDPPGGEPFVSRDENGEHVTAADRYDGRLAYLDRRLDALFAALKEEGVYDEAWVFVTGTHGQAFDENRAALDLGLTGAHLHVPLVAKPPATAARTGRVGDVARLIDVMPTVLQLAGVSGWDAKKLPAMQGADLSGLLGGAKDPGPGQAYAELHRNVAPDGKARHAMRTARFSYVRVEDGVDRFYDLTADPNEERNLLPERRRDADDLLARLRAVQDENLSVTERLFGTHPVRRDTVRLSGAAHKRLKELGYEE